MDSMKEEELECAVCLQTCVHPVKLPCSHIFCFLCVKGVANQSKRCAMCRQEIPADYLDNPNLLRKIKEKETEIEGYQWFYEGRNGWWQYDERTSGDLETFYNAGQRVCEVLVAGFLYTIDFDRMLQQRRNDPSRRRRIKRDMSSIPKKGVAGLKTFEDIATEEPLLCENDDDDHLNIEANNVDDISEISSITVPIVNLSSTVTDNTENSSSTETANTPVPSELSHVRLLFSNFYRNFHPPRRDLSLGSGPLSHPSSPLTRNRALRIREQLAQATSQSPCPSTGVNETEHHCNLVHPSNESCPISARESVTIDDITNNLVELSVNEEEDVQYYSLNDTEEYRLPNEDEL